MSRVTITDEVVEQLRDVLEAGVLDDEHNYVGARLAAIDVGHDELAAFVDAADAATYHEALKRARSAGEGDREPDCGRLDEAGDRADGGGDRVDDDQTSSTS